MTDRRTTIKWMLAAAASMPLLNHRSAAQAAGPPPAAAGYGSDPQLTKLYRPGDVWPLTLSAAQRRTAAALCNVILPGDDRSPGAESVGVVDFIDEWVSAPYPRQLEDRPIVLEGLAWMDAEALLRFEKYFAELDEPRHRGLAKVRAVGEDEALRALAAVQHHRLVLDLRPLEAHLVTVDIE